MVHANTITFAAALFKDGRLGFKGASTADAHVPGALLHHSGEHALRVVRGDGADLGRQGESAHDRLAQGCHPPLPEVLVPRPAAHRLQLLALGQG